MLVVALCNLYPFHGVLGPYLNIIWHHHVHVHVLRGMGLQMTIARVGLGLGQGLSSD